LTVAGQKPCHRSWLIIFQSAAVRRP
jgi:hypothetical protein